MATRALHRRLADLEQRLFPRDHCAVVDVSQLTEYQRLVLVAAKLEQMEQVGVTCPLLIIDF